MMPVFAAGSSGANRLGRPWIHLPYDNLRRCDERSSQQTSKAGQLGDIGGGMEAHDRMRGEMSSNMGETTCSFIPS